MARGEALFDPSRHRSHQQLTSSDGEPLLQPDRSYITLWDRCGGLDRDAAAPRPLMRTLNCVEARRLGLISAAMISCTLLPLTQRIRNAALEPLRLLPNHVLVLQNTEGGLVYDADGALTTRLCNFLYLRWAAGAAPTAGHARA